MEFFSDNNSNYDESNQNHSLEESASAPLQDTPNVFALFAKAMGVFAAFCAFFSFFFGTFICGGLAIILAVISKGYDAKMDKNARAGLLTGILAMIFQITFFVLNVYNIIYVPEYRQEFNAIYEEMYGEPMEESIDRIMEKLDLPVTLEP